MTPNLKRGRGQYRLGERRVYCLRVTLAQICFYLNYHIEKCVLIWHRLFISIVSSYHWRKQVSLKIQMAFGAWICFHYVCSVV